MIKKKKKAKRILIDSRRVVVGQSQERSLFWQIYWCTKYSWHTQECVCVSKWVIKIQRDLSIYFGCFSAKTLLEKKRKRKEMKMDRKSMYTLGVIFFIIFEGKFFLLLLHTLNPIKYNNFCRFGLFFFHRLFPRWVFFWGMRRCVSVCTFSNSQVHMVELTILS